ncbi:MAG: RlmE family RNA methyltransferase [Deltaproteobacteria bacterium]|nr:RlmE family RNA methyltransferase [Deltaproteobacteria bacterium]
MKPGDRPDPFTVRAQKAGYPARSVYKLEEIDRRCRLTRQGLAVLDLGAAPGSWTKYLAEKVGPRGRVVALDQNPLKVACGPVVTALELDVTTASLGDLALLGPFGLVVSDLAPHTTGIRDADVFHSVELVDRAIAIADATLAPGGNFVAKIFQGEGFDRVRADLRARFGTVRVLKPEASRKESTEVYLVGLGRKAPPPAASP